VPPRGLNPSGLVLVDKPDGPSSFALVQKLRDRTGARAGHAGTLDPFATGLLLVLLGSSTRLAQYLVGLDKRYVTEIDLRSRTSTGDREGEELDRLEPPPRPELEQAVAALVGEVELPIPTASAVRIAGERAYKLHRRGVVVEMPLRRSTVHSAELLGYADGIATLDLRVGSGAYVRAIADSLGGHCNTLRRTEIGPFRVEDADEERILPPVEALPFLPLLEVDAGEVRAVRAGRSRYDEPVRIVHEGELVAVNGTVMPS
jgi:tRNA pseudouridine55 synthase